MFFFLFQQLRQRAAPYRREGKLRRRRDSAKMAEADKENIACDLNLQDHSEWMTKLPNHLHRVPLHNLAIPGKQCQF